MGVTSSAHVDPQEWDSLAAFLGGGYFHCSAEVAYNSTCENVDPLFVKALDDSGQCIGITTGTLAASRVWPFSRYCAWAMLHCLPVTSSGSAESVRSVIEAVEEHLRHRGVFSVRVDSYDSPGSDCVLSALGYDLSARWEFIVDLTPDLDSIWSSFHGQRRTDIRKAEKLGVVTRIENTPQAQDLVFGFQAQSLHRRGVSTGQANEQTALARRNRLESGRVDVLVTYQNETPVNAALFGFFNGRPYYHVSGSSDVGYKCCGPAHLLWTAIRIYKERGARSLNLGAALADQTGLCKFKQDFGATMVPAPIGKKRISRLGSGLHAVRSLLQRKGAG